ncbi:hypothetical protein BH09PSE6_BH09PSE6_21350 [soil metagenome]
MPSRRALRGTVVAGIALTGCGSTAKVCAAHGGGYLGSYAPRMDFHLVAEVGASQVVMGTDYPIPWELHPVDHVLNTPTLNPSDPVAILGGNAARMLGLPAL